MVSGRLRRLFSLLKRLGYILVEPLTADEEIENFRLSMPETHTTTIDGSVGWPKRPPATLKCPDCHGEMYQHRSDRTIECGECWREFSREEFAEFELLYMTCPKCKHRMQHGRRHPNVVDFPEWATCNNCRYHWEFTHDFEPLV